MSHQNRGIFSSRTLIALHEKLNIKAQRIVDKEEQNRKKKFDTKNCTPSESATFLMGGEHFTDAERNNDELFLLGILT